MAIWPKNDRQRAQTPTKSQSTHNKARRGKWSNVRMPSPFPSFSRRSGGAAAAIAWRPGTGRPAEWSRRRSDEETRDRHDRPRGCLELWPWAQPAAWPGLVDAVLITGDRFTLRRCSVARRLKRGTSVLSGRRLSASSEHGGQSQSADAQDRISGHRLGSPVPFGGSVACVDLNLVDADEC